MIEWLRETLQIFFNGFKYEIAMVNTPFLMQDIADRYHSDMNII